MDKPSSSTEPLKSEITEVSGESFLVETSLGDVSLLPELEPFYVEGKDKIRAAKIAFRGSRGLLGAAAEALLFTPEDHGRSDPADPIQQEIRSISQFAHSWGLMFDARGVTKLIEDDFLGFGMEHRVGVLRSSLRVLKSYDPRDFIEEEGEVLNKPTDSLFDYLTDHLLSNYLFGDDVRLEGFYKVREALFIVISQPFIAGTHARLKVMTAALEKLGLRSLGHNRFEVGEPGNSLIVTDIHEGNVLIDRGGNPYVIDVHFKFGSRAARLKTLESLGLWRKRSG